MDATLDDFVWPMEYKCEVHVQSGVEYIEIDYRNSILVRYPSRFIVEIAYIGMIFRLSISYISNSILIRYPSLTRLLHTGNL